MDLLKHYFVLIFLLIHNNVQQINGFYVPGVAPQDFSLNDKVEVKVKIMKIIENNLFI
jgi:hypothetical protein